MKPLLPDDPRQVGRYRVLAELGEGGMGRVLLAMSPDGRFAAVKHVFPALARDKVFRDRFRREVEASRLVSGAYTAAVLDADTDTDPPWLASLYVAGPSLADALAVGGPLDVGGLRHLALTLAVALTDIHRAGLIHRDLKPGNVLLTHDGPRVIDFGIARAVTGSDLTATNALIGSPAFMSPEQAVGSEVTAASDVFSLGSLLLTAATGTRPFAGSSTPQTLYNVAHVDPDLSGLAPEIRAFVEPCLAKDPAARPTPQQLVGYLGPAMSSTAPWPAAVHTLIAQQEQRLRAIVATPPPLPAPALTTTPGYPAPNAHRRRTAGWSIAALCAALVAGLIVVLVQKTTSDGQQARSAATEPTLLPLEQVLAADRLRRVDPCAVLANEQIAGQGRLTPEEEPWSLHKCRYSSASGDVVLAVAERFEADATRSSGETAGLPVLESRVTGGCEVAVQLPDDPALAISATDSGAGSCAGVKAALDKALEQLRGDGVLWELPDDSVVGLDTCSLLDEQDATELLGPTTVSPNGLYKCEWDGSSTLQVRVERGAPNLPPDEDAEPMTFDGIDAYVQTDGDGYCAITWPHRRWSEDQSEDVTVFHMRSDEDPCETARQAAGAVAANLPGG